MTNRPSRAATLADVAHRAGTSTAVVSYVINGGPRPVAAETRERVLAAADELGYRPNRVASALRSRTTGVVGLVLADVSNPYFAALARHVEWALDEHGKLTLIGNAGYDADRQRDLVERFLAAQVDGLVIVSADGGTDVAVAAEEAGAAAVYLHNKPDQARAPIVPADNELAVHEAVAHLRWHGHERVAFLAGPDGTGPVDERLRAWRAVTDSESAGVDPLRCGYSRAAAAVLVRQRIADGTMPSALVTATDEQAIGVLSGAWDQGRTVPDRLAVISLDGTADSAYTAPALTVTQQPVRTMAEHAVAGLLGATPPSVPPAPLIVRHSCGCR